MRIWSRCGGWSWAGKGPGQRSLWMVLLDGVWSLAGVAPPVASTVLSLLFGYLTLLECARILRHLSLPPWLEPARGALAFTALMGIVLNRTFLTWLSSGLETSLFVFLATSWAGAMMRAGRRPAPRAIAWACTAAALAALTRPDGLLMVAASGALVLWHAAASAEGRWRWLGWRRSWS